MSEHEKRDGSATSLLSIEQVARELNVGRTFAWELTASGRLPTLRVGRLVRVRPADLRRYIDSLATRDGDAA